jgi:hypothetical protein
MRRSMIAAAFAAMASAGLCTGANAVPAGPSLPMAQATETSVTQVYLRHRGVYRSRVYGYRHAGVYRSRVYGYRHAGHYRSRVYGYRHAGYYRPRVYGYSSYYRPRVYGYSSPLVYGYQGFRGCGW